MEENSDKYFNEEGLKQFQLITNEIFNQLIKNPNSTRSKSVIKVSENSWLIRDFCLNNEFIVFDSSCSSSLSITFENCYFQSNVFFEGVQFSEYIKFKDCFFDGFVHFGNCEFQNLDIQECYFKNQVRFSSGKFNEVKFSQHDAKELTISGSRFKAFNLGYYVGSYLLNKLVVINNHPDNGPIEITGIEEITEFFLYGVFYGNLLMEDVRCRKFNIHNFTSLGELKIVGLKSTEDTGGTHLGIINSNLNKAEFYRLNLKSFSEVNFADSNFTNCIFINTYWPEKITAFKQSKIGPTDFRKNDNESNSDEFKNQQKETYRQLKIILGKQGDNVQEQIFYSREMNIYNSQLSWRPLFKGDFWDKLILVLSYSFSNYGTNFGKALKWFLLINVIVFMSLILFYNIDGIYFSWKERTWLAFWEAFKLFLNQLNPLHTFNQSLPSHAILLDLIGRIFSSYLIYHLIRTSRRFVR